MKNESLFIKGYELPKPYDKEETYKLLKLVQNGNNKAREKIITHNIRLVIQCVVSKYSSLNYDLNELVEEGIIGLIKAIDTFDINTNFALSTYAISCINNEILNFIKKDKNKYTDSLEKIIDEYKEEMLPKSKKSIDDITIDNCNYEKLLYLINKLNDKEQKIIKMRFGMINNKPCTLQEISNSTGIAKTTVAKNLNRALIKLRHQIIKCSDKEVKQYKLKKQEVKFKI